MATYMSVSEHKKRAALASLEYLNGGVLTLGVGTGSTVNALIPALAERRDLFETVVSSSKQTSEQLIAAGIEVTDLNVAGAVDLYIDGADEISKHFDLIKGGGGALTREKIIAAAARKFVCIADESKLVGMLGAFPLPIEVIPMARSYVSRQLIKMRAQPIWRENFVTDNGNEIIDVHNLQIPNPKEMENRLNQIAGVVTVGLFANRGADIVLLGHAGGVRQMHR